MQGLASGGSNAAPLPDKPPLRSVRSAAAAGGVLPRKARSDNLAAALEAIDSCSGDRQPFDVDVTTFEDGELVVHSTSFCLPLE